MPALSGPSVIESLFTVLAGVAESADRRAVGADEVRRTGLLLGLEFEACWRAGEQATAPLDWPSYVDLATQILQEVAPGSVTVGAEPSRARFSIPTASRPAGSPTARAELLAAALGGIAARAFGSARVDLEPGPVDQHPVLSMTVSLASDADDELGSLLFRRTDLDRLDHQPGEQVADTAQHSSRAARLRELGEQAVSVAHGLNNVLGTIVSQSSRLLERPASPDHDEGLRAIQMAGTDGARTVRRLLRLARGESGAEQDTPKAVDLNAVVRDAIERARLRWDSSMAERAATIEIRLGLSKLPPTYGTAADLREAVVNLLDNAVDAMPNGGTLTLNTSAHDGSVTLECRDTGVGMTDRIQARIFEPYFTTKGRSGTGVGLGIVRETVTRHHGTIEVRSESNRGTTITIRLPAAEVPSEQSVSSPAPPGEKGRAAALRILLVDDDAAFRSTFARWLAVDGHHVVAVEDGVSALDAIADGPWDAILIDERLPDRSGREVSQQVRARLPDAFVVLVTGFATRVDDAAYLEPWIDAVLPKPAKDEEIEQVLAAASAHRGAP